MPTPTPAPDQLYDIKAIPSFPFEPDTFTWLAASVLLFLLLLSTYFLCRRKPHYRISSLQQTLLSELATLPAEVRLADRKFDVLLHEIKRLIPRCGEVDVENLSPSELRLAAQNSAGAATDLIVLLAQFDEWRYCEPGRTLDSVSREKLRSAVLQLDIENG